MKENIIPTKQGLSYQLKLGNGNGPFLPKDIMSSNPKSIALLTGLQVLTDLTGFNQTLKQLNMSHHVNDSSLYYVENAMTTVNFFQGEIIAVQKQSKNLRNEYNSLKKQIQEMSQRCHNKQQKLMDQCMPVLKMLMKTIKQTECSQKENSFYLTKQIQSIHQMKRFIIHAIIQCEHKIIALEMFFGKSSSSNQC